MLYGNLMKLKHETNGSLMKIDPSHTAVPIKFTFTIPVGEFSMVFLNSACRFSQGIDIHFLHCRQKISESLHKNLADHGKSRYNSMQRKAIASAPVVTGSGFYAEIQRFFWRQCRKWMSILRLKYHETASTVRKSIEIHDSNGKCKFSWR